MFFFWVNKLIFISMHFFSLCLTPYWTDTALVIISHRESSSCGITKSHSVQPWRVLVLHIINFQSSKFKQSRMYIVLYEMSEFQPTSSHIVARNRVCEPNDAFENTCYDAKMSAYCTRWSVDRNRGLKMWRIMLTAPKSNLCFFKF